MPRRRHELDFEIERLVLRRPILADVPALFEFLGDTEAMRYTHRDATLRACRRRIAVHERRRCRDGYAPWTVATKADGRIVEWGGLYDDPFDPGWGVEVGYYFHPSTWGQGFATELVTACTDVADRILALPEVSAFARPENAGPPARGGEGRLRGGQVRAGDGALSLPASLSERPADAPGQGIEPEPMRPRSVPPRQGPAGTSSGPRKFALRNGGRKPI